MFERIYFPKNNLRRLTKRYKTAYDRVLESIFQILQSHCPDFVDETSLPTTSGSLNFEEWVLALTSYDEIDSQTDDRIRNLNGKIERQIGRGKLSEYRAALVLARLQDMNVIKGFTYYGDDSGTITLSTLREKRNIEVSGFSEDSIGIDFFVYLGKENQKHIYVPFQVKTNQRSNHSAHLPLKLLKFKRKGARELSPKKILGNEASDMPKYSRKFPVLQVSNKSMPKLMMEVRRIIKNGAHTVAFDKRYNSITCYQARLAPLFRSKMICRTEESVRSYEVKRDRVLRRLISPDAFRFSLRT